MSRSLSAPSASSKTELETVVNWPLLVVVGGTAFLLLAVPLVLACIAALRESAVKDPVASLPALPQHHPEKAAPTTTAVRPPLPSVVKQESAEATTPRQIYVKGAQPPIPPDRSPIPRVVKTPPQPPAQNPILQVRETNEPIREAKKPKFKRLDDSNEEHLISLLYEEFEEVDLESIEGTREKLLAEARKDTERKPAILALRAERRDLRGLPVREGTDCQARPEALKKMEQISAILRDELDRPTHRFTTGVQVNSQRADLLQARLRSSKKWFQEDGLSTLAQMLQVEDAGSRGEFVKRLANVKGTKASVLLARQAVFDLSWSIREEAMEALKDRPTEEYQQVLLDALCYPWAPVAAHAAETLVAVNDCDAVFSLMDMLDLPDPRAPVCEDNKWVVAEIVKINHFRNCLLCHPPSTNPRDPLRAIVPTPGQPMPRGYQSRGRGDFVRADITYLRQDFSQMLRVAKPDKWPEWQRFDYLVRKRELTAGEIAAHEKKRKSNGPESSYPQREAVLFALRELTGLDGGKTSADWYDLLWAGAAPR